MSRIRMFHRTGGLHIVILSLALSLLVSATGVLSRLDNLIYDLGQHFARPTPSPQIVIIGIDQPSLDELGRWPWPRPIHAQLLHTLCRHKPAAIGLDIVFSEPSRPPGEDIALADAINTCGNVVLPVIHERTSRLSAPSADYAALTPLPAFAENAAGIGTVGVNLGVDGIVRSIAVNRAQPHPLFSEALIRVARAPQPIKVGQLAAAKYRFPYAGPAGTYPHISYIDALQGSMPANAIEGRIILIGTTAIGMGDFLPTPLSTATHPMPGVEIQANILDALLHDRLIRHAPQWLTLLVNAALAILPMLWLGRLMPLSGLLASLAWAFALAGMAIAMPHVSRYWIAPSGALVAAMLAYPLWSRLQLDLARRHLREELTRLQAMLPASDETVTPHAKKRGFAGQIQLLQHTQRRLQSLEAQRNNALAFISHDLRMPIASVLQTLKDMPEYERQARQLQRAHDMAQTFLSLSRAEAINETHLKEIDLNAVLYQAVDAIYPLAKARGLNLRRALPDEPVWVLGDFSLLERAALNLLHNAVVLSPPETEIEIGLQLSATHVEFWVHDQGAGLSAEETQRLFQRFGNSAAAARHDSTGLGLYLVRTVAEKHKGQVGVDSTPGQGARFWMRLPLS